MIYIDLHEATVSEPIAVHLECAAQTFQAQYKHNVAAEHTGVVSSHHSDIISID